jgi:hypothetical protein
LPSAAAAGECCQGGGQGELDDSTVFRLGVLIVLGAVAPPLVLAIWAATVLEVKGPVEIFALLWFFSPALLLTLAAWRAAVAA